MSRLKKLSDYKYVENKIKEFEPLCDEILKISLKSYAASMDFPYDDGIFELVSQNPEYRQIVDNDLKQTIQKIKGVAEQWANDTKTNYNQQ